MHVEQVIEAITRDTVSGSSALADQLINALIKLDPQLSLADKHRVVEKIERLSTNKPFFGVFRHLADALKKCDTNWSTFLKAYKATYGLMGLKISSDLISLTRPYPKVFLLHSYSHTIVSTFKTMASDSSKIKILQTQSEPEKEGIVQAEKLLQLGMDVQLIEDNPPETTLSRVDYFITGADLVLPSVFINKSGTRHIAEKINRMSKPYFVLADPRKFVTMDVTELPSTFERIPRSLTTKILTGE